MQSWKEKRGPATSAIILPFPKLASRGRRRLHSCRSALIRNTRMAEKQNCTRHCSRIGFRSTRNMANSIAVPLSLSGRHSPMIGFFERVPIIAGSAVAILGAVALAGWALNLPFVTTATTGGYPILPLMALCFVLAGGCLTMAVRPHRTPKTEAIQQTLAALVATIAGLTLYEYLRGSESGFDLLLFGERLRKISSHPPGRISINSAGSLLLLSLIHISEPGYLFGVKGMNSLSQWSGMALWTAIGQLILGVGILVAVRERGVSVLLLDEGAAGVLTRRLLPAA